MKSRTKQLTWASVLTLAMCFMAGSLAWAGDDEEIKQEWQPTTLSDKTLAKINGGVEGYQKCLNDETRSHVNDKEDSRKVSDLILRNCETKLTVVKEAFDAEKVPGVISDRYIRSKRSRAAQQVVKVVMSAQALRNASPNP